MNPLRANGGKRAEEHTTRLFEVYDADLDRGDLVIERFR